jgi:hypothetical protein
MYVRDWDDILREVADSGVEPDGWRAVGGDRRGGIGEDLYLAHPGVGTFQLKTYARNPFEVQGLGAQIGSVDDELAALFPSDDDSSGLFGVQQPTETPEMAERRVDRLETVLETHAEAPTTPRAMLEDVMDAVESPAYGPMEFDQYDRPEPVEQLSDTFEEAEQLLTAEFEELVEEDVTRGFH